MKIAIVGTGISGLLAAHQLHREHEIIVYEACARLGGHSNTVRVELGEETHDVDTGFIVFNDRNYPTSKHCWPSSGSPPSPSGLTADRPTISLVGRRWRSPPCRPGRYLFYPSE